MSKNTRVIVILGLLAAMALGLVFTGCSLSVNKEFSAGQEVTLGETALSATATTAPVVPTQTKAPAAATKTPVPAATATKTPSAPTPSASEAMTITQDIVIKSSADEAGISYQGTFTMTASIQVGNVGGINYTSEPAAMPKGAEPYDVADLPDIGDAVQSADDLVVQVNGWQTVDADDEMQFVLVDVTVGNAGEERQLVATNPCMEIVSGDGHWYSLGWCSIFWMATLGEEQGGAMMHDVLDKLLQNDITSDFSVALDPGKAARGTAVFPVPKSAKQLAFGFQSYYEASFLLFNNEALATIFVPLGLEGQFPAIPDDVEPVEAGATYHVGESFQAPQRGVSFQVQSAWARLESLGNMWELQPDEQFVVVHAIAPASGGATALDAARELALVDDSGNAFELQEYATDWLTMKLGSYSQRGVLVFKGPRDASGLQLRFTPLDPATLTSDSPEPLDDEAAVIELGEVEAAPAVTVATAPGEPEPTEEPGGQVLGLGDEAVVGGLAITMNGYETQSGPEDMPAQEGKTWLIVYVTVENVSGAAIDFYADQFDFVDQSGGAHDELWNAASVWEEISADVLSFSHLGPADRLEDRLLVIQIEDELMPGLMLRYTEEDGAAVLWKLDL